MVKLKNTSCFYEKKKVLDNISLDILKGDFLCFVGLNGSGKTTILKTIANILPYQGNIYIENVDIKLIKREDFAKKIAFMEQIKSNVIPYKVKDIVLMSRYPYKKELFTTYTKEDINICEKYMKEVDIYHKKDKLISEISGGEMQRVFLAQTLSQEPDILILDEPTNFLDLKHKIDIMTIVKKWSEGNDKIVISALHDLDFVVKYSNKVVLLDEGKIIKKGSPKEVLHSKEAKEIYQVDIEKYYQKY